MNSKSRRDVIRYGRILKCALLVVLFAFLAIVYSRENAKDVSMDKIEAQLIKKTNIEKLQKQKPRDLVQFIGLVIKVKNKSDVKAVKDAVEKRITSQIEAFDNYGPEQVKELKNAIVTSRGKYVFYGVAKDPDKYEEVLLSVI